MTTVIKNLLARRQELIDRLAKVNTADERNEIEYQLEQINTALDFLDPAERKGR